MRVLLVITKGTWGGATKYVYDMARSLREKGHTVAVAYGPKGEITTKLDALTIPQYHVDGLTRDIGIMREFAAYKSLGAIIDEFNPDIVHVNSSKAGLAALAARRRGKRVIFTVHGWAFNERRNIIAKSIFKLAYLATIFLSTKVILVSQALKDQVRHWPFQDKMSVIFNGVEEPSLLSKENAREELIKKDPTLAEHKGATWLLTVAELHDSKGIDTAIAALASLRDEKKELPHYIVLGTGDEKWRLEKFIASYDLEAYVHLLGFVEHAATYMPAGDIFLLPSRTEALGYVLIEAGYANLPVIASRVGGIPEIITHNKTGLLVPPNSGTVLAVGIETLLADRKKAKELALNLHNHVKATFSLSHMVEKTLALYTTALHDEDHRDEHSAHTDASTQ